LRRYYTQVFVKEEVVKHHENSCFWCCLPSSLNKKRERGFARKPKIARIEPEMKTSFNYRLFLIREDPFFPCHPRAMLFFGFAGLLLKIRKKGNTVSASHAFALFFASATE
jgi:hypothetical protein